MSNTTIAVNQQFSRTNLHEQMQAGLSYSSLTDAISALSGATWVAIGDVVTITGNGSTELYKVHAESSTDHNVFKNTFQLQKIGSGGGGGGSKGSEIEVGEYEPVEQPYKENEGKKEPYVEGAVAVSGDMMISDAFNAVETTISALTQECMNTEEVIYGKFSEVDDNISSMTQDYSDSEEVMYGLFNTIISGAGLENSEGKIGYDKYLEGKYISGANSIHEATILLDRALAEGGGASTEEIDEIVSGTGLVKENDTIHYSPYSEGHIISAATSIHDATTLLDDALSSFNPETSGSEIPVGDYVSVEQPYYTINGTKLTYVGGAVSVSGTQMISEALNSIETTVSALTQECIDNEEVVYAITTAITSGTGLDFENDEIKYTPNTATTYISAATNLFEADTILDTKVNEIENRINNFDCGTY